MTGASPHRSSTHTAITSPTHVASFAIAVYAENHGEKFIRFELIAKTGDDLRCLDFGEEAVREAARAFDGAEVAALYESAVSNPYGGS